MKFQLITIGEPKSYYIREGSSEYLKRLRGSTMFEQYFVKDNDRAYEQIDRLTKGHYLVALHEHGRQYSSRQLAKFFEDMELQGTGTMSFVIGPADGHSDEFLAKSDYHLALSKLTFPHELAYLVMLEALYRSVSIRNGHPYHRD